MRGALLLRLSLGLAALRPAGPLARSAAAIPVVGPLIWIWDGSDRPGPAAGLVARRLQARRPDLSLALSAPNRLPDCSTLPERAFCLPAPENRPASIRMVLRAWKPALVVILGPDLPAALITEAQRAGLPILLADSQLDAGALRGWRGELRLALLARLDRIWMRDEDGRLWLDGRLVPERLAVQGSALAEPLEPLRCSEAERASMAEAIGARPVWLAAGIPAAELEAVLAAHRFAQRHAHRMLLLLAPEREADGPAWAQALGAQGWAVARRSLEGEPDAETELFLADDAAEYGLWYRLAAVTYMGGSLSGEVAAPRSPLEPAALGSAVLHGPRIASHRSGYETLSGARAARTVDSAENLAEALADLSAPDRAAALAHNAWAATSGGAGAAEAVAADIAALLREDS